MIANILSKWRQIAAVVAAVKLFAMLVEPPSGELLRWSLGASLALQSLSAGRLPSISATGPYGMMFVALTPFFLVWTALPVPHPSSAVMACLCCDPSCNNQAALAALTGLAAVMKVPNFLFDFLAGVLIYRLVERVTGSQLKASFGFLAWYMNPFNFGWLYLYGYIGDLIPATIVVYAVTLASDGKGLRCGFFTAIASVLRIFPIVTLPFLLLKARTGAERWSLRLLVGFISPVLLWLATEFATTHATFSTIVAVPFEWSYLLDLVNPNIPGLFVKWTPVIIASQFYLILRFWKSGPSAVHLATVSILALLLGAGPIFQQNLFLWVSPLLSICLALHPDEIWIYALTFSTDITCDYCGFLSGYTILGNLVPHGGWEWLPNLTIAGAFYAFKAAYLVKLNLECVLH